MTKFNLGKSENLVAHYTSLDTCCDYILSSGKLRLSPLSNTNDPYEFKKRLAHVCFDKKLERYKTYGPNIYDRINEEYSDFVLNNVKILCVTGTSRDEDTDNLKCYLHPRMWAHYGDNHEGAALIFDRIELETQMRKSLPSLICRNIKYIRKFDLGHENFVEIESSSDFKENIYKHITKYIQEIFFHKHIDWASEDELRMLCINSKKQGFEFAEYGNALKAIVLGINAKSEVYLSKIRSLRADIPVYQCAWATRGEYFVYRHHPESCGGLVVENFDDGLVGTELELKAEPALNEQSV